MYYNFQRMTVGANDVFTSVEFPLFPDYTLNGDIFKFSNQVEQELHLYLIDKLNKSQKPIILPQKLDETKDIVRIRVIPEVAFSIFLRHYRLKNEYTYKDITEKLNLGYLYNYLYLEKGIGVNIRIMDAVKKLFKDFPIDEIFR